MKPEETGSHYDRIALWWQQQHLDSTYGIAALERAIKSVENRSTALDIGCGSSGRFIEVLIKNGFTPTGVDISPMISILKIMCMLLLRRLHRDAAESARTKAGTQIEIKFFGEHAGVGAMAIQSPTLEP